MSPLILHYHPLSSCCHKVLIAIDVLGILVEKRLLNLGDPNEQADFLKIWPTGKMPLLMDEDRPIPETSIIIEYLQLNHANGEHNLIPRDPQEALVVRLWDRLLDHYVMTPMQALTADLLRADSDRDPLGVSQARERLSSSYALINHHLRDRQWIAGNYFSMADCAAAPALFYAASYVPLPPQHEHLVEYFERLLEYPPVQRTIDQARPYFKYYPGRDGLSQRFLDPLID